MQKLNMVDNEELVKACHDANFLVQDLRCLIKSKNPEFVKKITKIFEKAKKIEEQLCQLETEYPYANHLK